MKLQLISDQHGVNIDTAVPKALAPILLIAGDHEDNPQYLVKDLNRNAKRFEHIIFVPGNHEFYRGRSSKHHRLHFRDMIAQWLEYMYTHTADNVHVLYADSIEIDGVWFHGHTLWTNFGNCYARGRTAVQHINDFRFVPGAAIQPYMDEHNSAKEFLNASVGEDDVVITHFCPISVRETLNPAFPVDDITYYYHNAMFGPHPRLWCFGHTHYNCDFVYGGTRFVSNQNRTTDPTKVIEL